MDWIEIYSQTEASHIFASCTLDSCDLGSGKNFINFDRIRDMTEYHFKLVWNEGKSTPGEQNLANLDVELEWIQKQNPLSATNADMSPTDPRLYPSNRIPPLFMGLSLSDSPHAVLLDGTNNGWWFYGIGNRLNWHGGNTAFLHDHSGINSAGKIERQRTQLFVLVKESTPVPTDPPITDPPITDPPITDPPITDPPIRDPPITPVEGKFKY